MSDETLRGLERRYRETQSETDGAAWLQARVRAGELDPTRLAWVASAPTDNPLRRMARAAGAEVLTEENYAFWEEAAGDAALDGRLLAQFGLDCGERVLPILIQAGADAGRLEGTIAAARACLIEVDPERHAGLREELRPHLGALIGEGEGGRNPVEEATRALSSALAPHEPELHYHTHACRTARAAVWSAANPEEASRYERYSEQPFHVSESETAWQQERLCAYLLGETEHGQGQLLSAPAPPVGRALHTAVGYLSFEHLRRLVATGCDLNVRDRQQSTPLHALARDNYEDDRSGAIGILLEAGADPEARDNNELTPLMVACSDGNVAAVRAFLEGGADVNAVRASDGMTPLKFAAAGDPTCVEPLRLLLAAGARPDDPVGTDQTALMLAACRGSVPKLRALIESGADSGLRCGLPWAQGDTAADLAQREDYSVAVGFLRALEAPRERTDRRVDAGSLGAELERLRADGASGLADALERAASVDGLVFLETREHAGGAQVPRLEHEASGVVFCLVVGGALSIAQVKSPESALLAAIFGGDDVQDEEPQPPPRELEVAPFLLAEVPLTWAQWSRLSDLVDLPDVQREAEEDDACPVRGLSFDQADALAVALGSRLPSADEWEFACRGGSLHRYGVAESLEDVFHSAWVLAPKPSPVGRRLPSPFGFFDLIGSVEEWLADLPSDVLEDQPEAAGTQAMARGGSWRSSAYEWSPTVGGLYPRAEPQDHVGLRLARSLP